MRIPFLCIFSLAAMADAAAYGQSHAATIMGTVSYQVPNASVPTVKSFPFTNSKILESVFSLTGTTTGVSSPKDLDLAINDSTHELDVVAKSTSALYFEIAQTGSDSVTFGAIESQGKKTDLDTEIQTDYQVKVIVNGQGELALCGLQSHVTLSGSNVTAINGSFSGGTASNEAVQGEISGSIKTSKKVYNVIVPQ